MVLLKCFLCESHLIVLGDYSWLCLGIFLGRDCGTVSADGIKFGLIVSKESLSEVLLKCSKILNALRHTSFIISICHICFTRSKCILNYYRFDIITAIKTILVFNIEHNISYSFWNKIFKVIYVTLLLQINLLGYRR